jgi:hypothetical protein
MRDFSKRIVYAVDGMQRIIITRNRIYKAEGDTKLLPDSSGHDAPYGLGHLSKLR